MDIHLSVLDGILIALLIVLTVVDVRLALENKKLRREVAKGIAGIRTVAAAFQQRDDAQLEAVVAAVMPAVLKMDPLDVPNAKKRTAVATSYLQHHPGASYSLVTAAIDEACRRRKEKRA